MKWPHIAIPSYKRSSTLLKKTLLLLSQNRVPQEIVTVFVANEHEKSAYEEALASGGWGNAKIAIGEVGMGAIRRFIARYYPEGDHVLNIDDDVTRLLVRVDDKKVSDTPLSDVVSSGFRLLAKSGLRLWGVYPNKNPYFMKPTVSTDLKYINGTLWGNISNRDDRLLVTLDDKEDFERSIRYYAIDGGVVRLNYIATETKYYTEPGGMQESRTERGITESAHKLVRMFPQFCSINNARKGHTEVKLADRRGARV